MTSTKFQSLTEMDKKIFISKLMDAIRLDDNFFKQARSIIAFAEAKGLLDNTKYGIEETTKTNI